MIYKNITLIMLISLIIIGCNARPRVGPPWMEDLLYNGPDGPPLFQQGWRDGCETGISATGNHVHKMFYKFKQDYRYAQNHKYYTGWKHAETFCQRYVFQYLKRDLL